MKTQKIHIGSEFEKRFLKLPRAIQEKAHKTEDLFRSNPLHPSLRLHKLRGKLGGLWSISVDRRYRIVFRVCEDKTILFVSIGIHSIYED